MENLRKKAETTLSEKRLDAQDLSYDDARQMIHELQVQQLELELQNEELVRTQMELESSRKRLSELYNFAPVGYISLDQNGYIREANVTFFKMAGADKNEIINKHFSKFVYKEDQDLFYFYLKDLKNSKKKRIAELRLNKKDTDFYFIKLEGSYVGENQTSESLIRLVASDVSHRKLAEMEILSLNQHLEQKVKSRTEELEETLEDLKDEIIRRKDVELELRKAKDDITNALIREKELNELKTRLINMISHEYRTPLTIILGAAGLIKKIHKKKEYKKIEEYLETIRMSVEDMTRLMEDTITIGRINSEKMTTRPGYLEMVMIVKEVISEIEVYDESCHSIILKNENDYHKIISDEKHIRRILKNLLTNAAKFSPENSEIVVSISQDDKYLLLMIEDQGIGILPEDREQLFDVFYRGKNIGNVSGTGLGLSIVKNCLSAINGKIEFSSEPGKGTKVTVSLPELEM
ncbi:MAG: ATP-binding protein [Candidatus Kapaibacterium sp.]